jgi:hypothetical protein
MNTTIMLAGGPFAPTLSYWIQVGDSNSVACTVHDRALVCADVFLPTASAGQNLPISISVNELGFVDTSVGVFVLELLSTTVWALPPKAPKGHAFALCSPEIRGDPDRFTCHFGTLPSVVVAAPFAARCVRCEIPKDSSLNGETAVALRDAHTSSVIGSVEFEVYEEPTIASLAPQLVESGDQRIIAVEGSGFRADLNFSCLLGDSISTSAQVVTSFSATCVFSASALLHHGEIDVLVSNDAIYWSSTKATLDVRPPVEVDSVFPTLLLRDSGSTNLTVVGRNFIQDHSYCRFSSANGTTLLVTKASVTSQAVVCAFEPAVFGVGPVGLTVRIDNSSSIDNERSNLTIMVLEKFINATNEIAWTPSRSTTSSDCLLGVGAASVQIDSTTEAFCTAPPTSGLSSTVDLRLRAASSAIDFQESLKFISLGTPYCVNTRYCHTS